MEELTIRLKKLRRERRITQKEMVEYPGIAVRACQFDEEGKRRPEFDGFVALADFFDVTMDSPAGRSDIPDRRWLPCM